MVLGWLKHFWLVTRLSLIIMDAVYQFLKYVLSRATKLKRITHIQCMKHHQLDNGYQHVYGSSFCNLGDLFQFVRIKMSNGKKVVDLFLILGCDRLKILYFFAMHSAHRKSNQLSWWSSLLFLVRICLCLFTRNGPIALLDWIRNGSSIWYCVKQFCVDDWRLRYV